MQSNLYIIDKEEVTIDDIVYNEDLQKQVTQLLKEFKYLKVLQEYDLPVHHKILLYGKTGCGKTMTAKAIARTLKKKIILVNLATIISSRLGETAKNIADLFKKAKIENAVLFFDEFDSLGKIRDYEEKDSGEMKRVVNVLLQQIDYLPAEVILIAATNLKASIDEAIMRRFELQLKFETPSKELLDLYYDKLSSKYPPEYCSFQRVYNISYAEAKTHLQKEVKHAIIEKLELT